MFLKDKISKKFFLIFFIFFFLSISSDVFSANININPKSGSYRVGDSIKVKVYVESETSINAISSNINFSKDFLYLSSISKSGSIVSFWAQDPVFSNTNGSISFDGVILNGFSGKNGNILTLNFKAQKEGSANVLFSDFSILANDGVGTEVGINSTGSYFDIGKALPKKVEEPKSEEKVGILESPKETILKIREIEKSSNLPENSLVILIILLIVLILIIVLIYLVNYINKIRFSIKNRLYNVEQEIRDNEPDDKVLKDIDEIEKEL